MEGVFLHVATWLSLAGGVWGLFALGENTVRPEVRASVSQWLRNPAGALEQWPATFAKVFDSVFGERHISWRCFGRSCVASLLSVITFTLVWGALRPTEFSAFIQNPKFTEVLLYYLTAAVFFNLIPDYFSLLESRYIIRWMSDGSSTTRVSALLVIDFVATAAILSGGITAYGLAAGADLNEIGKGISLFLKYGPFLSAGQDGLPAYGVFLYSTYFTSVWVWLYALSALAVRLVSSIGHVVGRLDRLLDIENKPLHTIGLVWSLLVTLGYFVMLVLP